MTLEQRLLTEKEELEEFLNSDYGKRLEQNQLDRLDTLLSILSALNGAVTVSDASAANQTVVQANAGSDASKALAVQGITNGKAIPVTGTFYQATQPVSVAVLPALSAGSNTIGAISNTSFGISGTLPAFASTPTFNIGTAPNLTITNINGTVSLPTGASTSALQTTGNTSLTNIDGKLPSTLGTKTAANSFAIIEASDSPLQPASMFAASTICLTTALSEGSLALTSAKKISMFSRTSTSFRISTTANNTINTQNFETIPSGNEYYQDGLNFTGTFYFSAETLPTATTVASCTTTNGNSNVTSSNSFSAVVIGQAVSGTGVPANSFVIRRAADGLSITLGDANGNTVNATASGTVTLTFSGAVIRISRWS